MNVRLVCLLLISRRNIWWLFLSANQTETFKHNFKL